MSSFAHPAAARRPSPWVLSPNPEESSLGVGVKWYAIYTRPRHEKRVDQHCKIRAIDAFCPVYKATRRWSDGSNVTLELPLFPGYLFVRIPTAARTAVLNVPGVLAIVSGTDGKMAELADEEIAVLREGLTHHRAEPHALLTVGQRVRIRSGALAGMVGIITRAKGLFRVVLTLDVITKSIAVEIDERELEPLGPSCAIRN